MGETLTAHSIEATRASAVLSPVLFGQAPTHQVPAAAKAAGEAMDRLDAKHFTGQPHHSAVQVAVCSAQVQQQGQYIAVVQHAPSLDSRAVARITATGQPGTPDAQAAYPHGYAN